MSIKNKGWVIMGGRKEKMRDTVNESIRHANSYEEAVVAFKEAFATSHKLFTGGHHVAMIGMFGRTILRLTEVILGDLADEERMRFAELVETNGYVRTKRLAGHGRPGADVAESSREEPDVERFLNRGFLERVTPHQYSLTDAGYGFLCGYGPTE